VGVVVRKLVRVVGLVRGLERRVMVRAFCEKYENPF